jgi:uncharacterized protein (TIGR03435 family)
LVVCVSAIASTIRGEPWCGSLIALAYGDRDLAPIPSPAVADWVRSESFDIEATIPVGTPLYTLPQVIDGRAPVIQKMLQALLTDRFQLALGGETREMPVYNLVVTGAGKLTTADRWMEPHELTVPSFHAAEISMKGFTRVLQELVRRPVVDKTNLTGFFDIFLEFRPLFPARHEESNTPTDPLEPSVLIQFDELQWQLQEQLGLKLESGRAPVEVLVIDHAERPTPN